MGRETYSQHRNRLHMARILREFAALPEERRTNRFASRVIDLWSKRLARDAEPLLVPTIGAAVRAGRPWLSFQCPACTMIGEADVRKFDRHPQASIQSLIQMLACPRCPGGPFVKLTGLAAGPVIMSRRAHMPKHSLF